MLFDQSQTYKLTQALDPTLVMVSKFHGWSNQTALRVL